MTLTVWDPSTSSGQAEPRPRVKLHLPRVEVRLPRIEELAENWPIISKLLEKATRRTGCYEPIDLLVMATRGQVGIWLCEVAGTIKAAIVTEVKQYPRRRILEVMFLGGIEMSEWLDDALDALTSHAKQTGCEHLATSGRRSWMRILGAKPTGDIIMTRGLKD
jgi:hypothetical protein